MITYNLQLNKNRQERGSRTMNMKPLVAEKSETGNPFLFQGLGIIILILKEIH